MLWHLQGVWVILPNVIVPSATLLNVAPPAPGLGLQFKCQSAKCHAALLNVVSECSGIFLWHFNVWSNNEMIILINITLLSVTLLSVIFPNVCANLRHWGIWMLDQTFWHSVEGHSVLQQSVILLNAVASSGGMSHSAKCHTTKRHFAKCCSTCPRSGLAI